MECTIEAGFSQTTSFLPTLFFYDYVPALCLHRLCTDDLSYDPYLLLAESRPIFINLDDVVSVYRGHEFGFGDL